MPSFGNLMTGLQIGGAVLARTDVPNCTLALPTCNFYEISIFVIFWSFFVTVSVRSPPLQLLPRCILTP